MEYKSGVIVMTAIGADAILAVVAAESAIWKQFCNYLIERALPDNIV